MSEESIDLEFQEARRAKWRENYHFKSSIVSESDIYLCQCCGIEIGKNRIFCDLHNTPINRQIFEFFSELPFKPRGVKLYELFAWYLAAKFGYTEKRNALLKSSSGIGKSYLMDMIAFIELTHFPNSFTVIGSISERISKQHVERLRDWIGDTIFSRYIYGSKDATASRTEIKFAKLNSKVVSIPQCFDESAEILTDDGWKYFKDLTNLDLVAQITDDFEIEYTKPSEIIKMRYIGKMLQFKNKTIDIVVTPNHRFVVKHAKAKNYSIREAKDINSQVNLITNVKWKGVPIDSYYIPKLDEKWFDHHYTIDEKTIPIKDWLKFLGLYIAEGNCESKKYNIQIPQSLKSRYLDEIDSIITALPYHHTIFEKNGMRRYTIQNKQLWKILKELGNSHTKYVPNYVKQLNPELIKEFLHGYLIGDGYSDYFTGLNCCVTASKFLVNDLHECFIKAGYSNPRISLADKKHILWRCKEKKVGITISKKFKREIDFDGYVYCVNVPSGKILVRCNGVSFVSGNSEHTITGMHPSLLLIDEIGRMRQEAYNRCYSDDTEVLTENGWMLLKDICEEKLQIKIATLNPDTEKVEYHYPTQYYSFPYKGFMYNQYSRDTDLLITPNHLCYVSGIRGIPRWKKKIASDLPLRYRIFKKFDWEGKEQEFFILPSCILNGASNGGVAPEKKIPMDDWLAFFGIYLAEGSSWTPMRNGKIREYRVQISQCNDEKRAKIANLISKLGYKFQDLGNGDLCISNKQLYTYLHQFGRSHDKFIPKDIKNLSKRQLNILLDWMMMGDGSMKNRFSGYYCSISEELIEDMFEVAMKVGCGISKAQYESKSGCKYLNIRFKPSSVPSVKNNKNLVYYDSNVYDIEIQNHLFYIRRNGKWSLGTNSLYQMGRTTNAISIAASTPFGESRAMYTMWMSDDVKKIDMGIGECWWVSPSVIEQAKKDLPPEEFTQLFLGEFGRVTNRVIPDDVLLQALERGEHLPPSKNLIMGIDFGESIDPTGIVILDMESGDIKYTTTFKEDIREQLPKIREIYGRFKPYRIIADNSHKGSSIIKLGLPDLPIEGVSMHNEKLKGLVIDRLRMGFFNNKVNIADSREFAELLAQLKSYVYLNQEHTSYGPLSGHDDLVDALALALKGMDVSSMESTYSDSWRITRAGARGVFLTDAQYSDSPWAVSVI